MHPKPCWITFLFTLSAFFTTGFATSPVPLPKEGEIPDWIAEGRQLQFVPSTLFNYINGGAEIFNEFGFQELTVQNYRKGDQEITVELYRMDGGPAALGMFYRQGGQNHGFPSDPDHLTRSPYQWTLQKGCWFVQINAPANARGLEQDMAGFARSIGSQITPQIVLLFDLLPSEKRVAGSEFLVRGPYGMQPVFTFGEGDILQLEGRTFVIGADYSDSREHNLTRLLVLFDSEEKAAGVFGNLKENLDPYLEILKQNGTQIIFRDFKKEYGIIALDGQRLDISLHISEPPY